MTAQRPSRTGILNGNVEAQDVNSRGVLTIMVINLYTILTLKFNVTIIWSKFLI